MIDTGLIQIEGIERLIHDIGIGAISPCPHHRGRTMRGIESINGSSPTAVVLGLFSLPHMGEALGHLQPLHGSLAQNCAGFVGIVLALSGVEAIANATGVMKLDPGSTDAKPCV